MQKLISLKGPLCNINLHKFNGNENYTISTKVGCKQIFFASGFFHLMVLTKTFFSVKEKYRLKGFFRLRGSNKGIKPDVAY